MDDHGFDQLSRRIGAVISRRAGIRALVVGLSVVVGPAATGATEVQRCLKNGKRCGPGEKKRCRRCCSKHSEPVGKARKGKRRRRKCASDPGVDPPCIPAGQSNCFDASSCCAGASCRADESCVTGSCVVAGADCPGGIQDCCFGDACMAGKCCGGEGGTCAAAGDCCGDLVCNGAGVCVATCTAALNPCAETVDCCFGRTCTFDFSSRANECCVLDGEGCDPDENGGHCCNEASSCLENGLCGVCVGPGGSCAENPDICCPGLSCAVGETNTCFSEDA